MERSDRRKQTHDHHEDGQFLSTRNHLNEKFDASNQKQLNDQRFLNRYDPNINYHTDSPFRLLKVWLLLNDVGPGNGPLVYCEKTQQVNDWRILRDLLEYSKYNKKYRASYSHFSRMELAHLANDFPDLCIHERQITGKAGDIVIADTRGIHGGTTLLDGYRLQLGMVFTGLGNLSMDDIPDKVIALAKDSH